MPVARIDLTKAARPRRQELVRVREERLVGIPVQANHASTENGGFYEGKEAGM